jgi:antagonist of KipI
MGKLSIVRAGPLTSVQDLGRAGHRAFGVSTGGALDHFAARIANLVVGNSPETALLETTLGGTRFRFDDTRRVAWCGGDFAVTIDELPIPAGRCAMIKSGEEIKMEGSRRGCRVWLAISGGIEVEKVLDSRSTDLRAGFGGFAGRALRDGDELPLGEHPRPSSETGRLASWSAPREWVLSARPAPRLRVTRGTEWEMLTQKARNAFWRTNFMVGSQADRMGARLEGAELARRHQSELLSEGVVPGTVQLTNDGHPILLLGDCQTIGGYPKIAHVITVDLPVAAQLSPGDVVGFEEVTTREAIELFRARQRELELFQAGLTLRAI